MKKKSGKILVQNINGCTFNSKPKRQASTTPKKIRTSSTKSFKADKSFSNIIPVSPISVTQQNTRKYCSPFDQILPLETSFNRLICKQISPSPNKDTQRFNAQMSQQMDAIISRSSALGRQSNLQMVKDFLLQSNKIYHQHIKKQNKKIKSKIKQQIYQYIQGIKKQIIQNLKLFIQQQFNQNNLVLIQQRIKIIQSKLNPLQQTTTTIKTLPDEFIEQNSKQLKRIDENIFTLNSKIQQCTSLVKIDFFSSFSDKLSEVIQKYNENFSAVNYNVEVLSEMMKDIINVMREIAKNKALEKSKISEQSPMNRTAKFTSIQI